MNHQQFCAYLNRLSASDLAWLQCSIAWADIVDLARRGEYELAVTCLHQWLG
jgi:hypothetical protein